MIRKFSRIDFRAIKVTSGSVIGFGKFSLVLALLFSSTFQTAIGETYGYAAEYRKFLDALRSALERAIACAPTWQKLSGIFELQLADAVRRRQDDRLINQHTYAFVISQFRWEMLKELERRTGADGLIDSAYKLPISLEEHSKDFARECRQEVDEAIFKNDIAKSITPAVRQSVDAKVRYVRRTGELSPR